MSEQRARIESVVRSIWQEVLEVDKVTSGDNFMDMGGNSLKAGEVVWRIRDELDLDVSMDLVLDRETFGDLVDVIAATAFGTSATQLE